MLLWIAVGGGLTLMMGQHTRSESLFYYFRLEDQVPANHLLRLIDTHIDFSFVREQLKDSYSDTGRPSIDPERRSGAGGWRAKRQRVRGSVHAGRGNGSGQFLPTGAMTTARFGHTASLLRDGRVLVTGGYGASGQQLSAS
jgi:hypothetical protein